MRYEHTVVRAMEKSCLEWHWVIAGGRISLPVAALTPQPPPKIQVLRCLRRGVAGVGGEGDLCFARSLPKDRGCRFQQPVACGGTPSSPEQMPRLPWGCVQ